MSVDTLRETFHINRIPTVELVDFLTAQTYRHEITVARNKIKSLNHVCLQSVCDTPIRQGKSPKYTEGKGLTCIKPKNTRDLIIDLSDCDTIDCQTESEITKQKLEYGDVVITRSGAGTIGRASIFTGIDDVYTNDHLFIIRASEADGFYVGSYLNSYWGERLLEAGISGSTGQLNLSNEHVKQIDLYLPNPIVQKYIGDKVRQAEQLRAWAKLIQSKIKRLVTTPAIENALSVDNKKSSWTPSIDLTSRLDPKYYGSKALAVLYATTNFGIPLKNLVVGICNGFEERNFFDEGITYITVSEVSSGRLDVGSAPKIHSTTDIPSKAKINDKCVLVVRTGSIGTAVKVDRRDAEAVISSHLIKLEFESEETAAAVASFLNAEAGKVLLQKISYGAVQPQIGQDELLALHIPQYIIDQAESLHRLTTAYEDSIRLASSLVLTAKYLVESLIDGLLTEQQLIDAQKALEADDNSLDRDILGRLTTKGLDGDGDPLFADLDQLYGLLAQCQQMDE